MTESRPILEAIALKQCLEVTYNRTRMTLAPHILYTRNGDLFVDAVAIKREGRAVCDPRLGTYKLAGLAIDEASALPFEPILGFEAHHPKYAETTPFSIS